MAAPKRKRVSDEVLRRISEAINAIAADENAPRTKMEIERRSGLGHDTVARAFRQDADEDSQWKIGEKLNVLSDPEAKRRSPAQQRKMDADQKVIELRQQVSLLEKTLDRYAMSLFAYHLQAQAEIVDGADTIPIGRNRHRRT